MLRLYSHVLLKNLGKRRWQNIIPLVRQSTNAARVPPGTGGSKDPMQYV